MRTMRRVGVALLVALALSVPVFAQSTDDRLSVNAAIGPSFANLGTTFSAMGGVDYKLNDRATVVGEFGVLPHAPFDKASNIAGPLAIPGSEAPRVNAYHFNGNLKVRPFEVGRLEPYVTGGFGSFTTSATINSRPAGTSTVDEDRRVTDFATNLGAGLTYHLNKWVGLTADYRTFFVHRSDDTPHVNRFTTGLTLSLK